VSFDEILREWVARHRVSWSVSSMKDGGGPSRPVGYVVRLAGSPDVGLGGSALREAQKTAERRLRALALAVVGFAGDALECHVQVDVFHSAVKGDRTILVTLRVRVAAESADEGASRSLPGAEAARRLRLLGAGERRDL